VLAGALLMPGTPEAAEIAQIGAPADRLVGPIRHRGGVSFTVHRPQSLAGPLAAAAGAIGVLVAVALVALRTGAGQRLDERAMLTVVAGREAELAVLSLLGRISIGAVLVVSVVCVVLAVMRGRVRLAAAALMVIAGANLTTQLLKEVLLERSALDVIAPNSLPSGHTTVVASAVGALLLVTPWALRLMLVVAGAFAVTITAASTVVAGWHRPADIVAALAVSLVWTALGSMVVGGSHRGASRVVMSSVAGSAGALVLLVAIGVRPADGWGGFLEATVVLGAMALVTALTVGAMERISPTTRQP
jgi:membrane-associated phospholipid phosphatase